MGYKVENPVWDYSKAKGGDLLVLLAIANGADNETGIAFPSIRYLAGKTRLTERAVQFSLKRLVNMGELEVIQNTGRVNTFRVTLFAPELSPREGKRLIAQAEAAVKQRQGGEKISPPKPVDNPVDKHLQGGEKISPRGVKPTSPGGEIHDTPYKVLESVIESVSLSRSEREMVTENLKRLFPGMTGLPDAVPSGRALLFLHKLRLGEVRREIINSPVAYMLKMADEDIAGILALYRERGALSPPRSASGKSGEKSGGER